MSARRSREPIRPAAPAALAPSSAPPRPRPSRRSVLRAGARIGAAAAALPHALVPAAARAQGKPPRRLLVFYVGEGMEPTTWWPRAPRQRVVPAAQVQFTGTDLAALETWKSRVAVVRGLDHAASRQEAGCYHNWAMRYVLTGGYGFSGNGRTIDHRGVLARPGTSIDRLLARFIKGENVPFGTYELGVLTTGRANPVWVALSYDDKTRPRYPQDDPVRVYNELFGNARPIVRRRGVLDLARAELAKLRCAIGVDARDKLDAHLEGVQALEHQLAQLAAAQASARVPVVDPAVGPVYRDFPALPRVLDAQMNIAVSLLASDMTRVVTLQNMHTVSRQVYPWLASRGYVDLGDHHDRISHNTSSAAVRDRSVIYAWYAEQFAELMRRLDAVKEADGSSLLDNTLLLYTSEQGYANRHDPANIPTILAGGTQGALNLGQVIDFDMGGQHRAYNDLLLTLANGFGVDIKGFGDLGYGAGPIGELLA